MLNSTTMRMPPYSGDGTVSAFAIEFNFFLETDIQAIVVNTATAESEELDLETDFEITGGQGDEGELELVDDGQEWIDDGCLADGYELHIIRKTVKTQGTSISTQGGNFYPDVHEKVFDKITMIAQELWDFVGRCARLPDHITPDLFDPRLPEDIVGASELIPITNVDGDGWKPAEDWIPKPLMESAVAAGTSAAEDAAAAADSATAAAQAQAAAETAQGLAEDAQAAAEAALAAAQGTPVQESIAGVFAAGNTTYELSEAPAPPAGLMGFLGPYPQVKDLNYTLVGNVVTFAGEDTSDQPFIAFYKA